MPITLIRKLNIIAADDGLLIVPSTNPRSRSPPASPSDCVKVEYRTNKISTCGAPEKRLQQEGEGVEAHGVVGGFLELFLWGTRS